jgi:hypothetical protein
MNARRGALSKRHRRCSSIRPNYLPEKERYFRFFAVSEINPLTSRTALTKLRATYPREVLYERKYSRLFHAGHPCRRDSPIRRPARGLHRSIRRRPSSLKTSTTRRRCSAFRPSATSTPASPTPPLRFLKNALQRWKAVRLALAVASGHAAELLMFPHAHGTGRQFRGGTPALWRLHQPVRTKPTRSSAGR